LDGLVASGKGNVEPGNPGVNDFKVSVKYQPTKAQLTVITSDLQFVRDFKAQVLFLDSTNVNVLHCTRVGDDCFKLDSVDKRFSQSNLLHARVVESVYIVPV